MKMRWMALCLVACVACDQAEELGPNPGGEDGHADPAETVQGREAPTLDDLAWSYGDCPPDDAQSHAACEAALYACVTSEERGAANPELVQDLVGALLDMEEGINADDEAAVASRAAVVDQVFQRGRALGVTKGLGYGTANGQLLGSYTCGTETAPTSAIFCPNASATNHSICEVLPSCAVMGGDTFVNVVNEGVHGDLYIRLFDGLSQDDAGEPILGQRVFDFHDAPGGAPFEVEARSWYQQGVSAGEGTWVPIYINNGSCEPIVGFSAPIISQAHGRLGVAYGLTYLKDEPCYQALVSQCGVCRTLGSSTNYPAEAALGTACAHR